MEVVTDVSVVAVSSLVNGKEVAGMEIIFVFERRVICLSRKDVRVASLIGDGSMLSQRYH